MITLAAGSVREELEQLGNAVRKQALASGKDEFSSDGYNTFTIHAHARWRTARNGRRTVYRMWQLDDRFVGWNHLIGTLRKAGIV